jgi:hypothetical protein
MKLTGFSTPHDCESCRPPAQAVARAQTRTTKDSSALKLTLKTAEGDTVEISLEASSLRQSERASARGPGGRASYKSDSRSDSFTASVNVEGDLSDAELEDIQGLLRQLAGGEATQDGTEDLDTISAYQYSYQRTREVSRSQVEIFA